MIAPVKCSRLTLCSFQEPERNERGDASEKVTLLFSSQGGALRSHFMSEANRKNKISAEDAQVFVALSPGLSKRVAHVVRKANISV